MALIVSAVRTPTGRFLGALKDIAAPDLGALVIREAVSRAGIDPDAVEDCIMGHVVSAGVGQAPARQAALRAGLSESVSALTINKVCGSGLKAVMLATQGIAAGDIDVAVAGGMESMSNCPYLLTRAREGLRLGNGPLIDSMVNDGLWCSFEQSHMGIAGEVVAREFSVSRAAQDDYALHSHRKAARAHAEGRFAAEMLPVACPGKRDESLVLTRDEPVRGDATLEALGALRPAFAVDGTVTAGNAPPVNDAAAALVVVSPGYARQHGLRPMARVVGQATSGLSPKYVLLTPIDAVRRVAAKVGWALGDVDLFELNEAFSVQMVVLIAELGIDRERVNVNGGAVALGHPIGASGARILTTLLHALEQRQLRRGIAALCLGGGNGVALAVERV